MRSPVPAARLRALERLHAAGHRDRPLSVAPILPGITDGASGLDRLFAAARAAGAGDVTGSPLRLGPAAARARFLPHPRAGVPRLAAHRWHYSRAVAAPAEYGKALSAARIAALRVRYGFALKRMMSRRCNAPCLFHPPARQLGRQGDERCKAPDVSRRSSGRLTRFRERHAPPRGSRRDTREHDQPDRPGRAPER